MALGHLPRLLRPGANLVGTTAEFTVRFPEGSAPPSVGVLHWNGELEDAAFTFEASPQSRVLVERDADGDADSDADGDADDHADGVARDEIVTSCRMEPDTSESPTRLRCGRVTFWIIRRGDEFAVRARDPESPLRLSFDGVDRFAIDPSYRVFASLERYETPRPLLVPNVLGYADTTECYGEVRFELNGQDLRLLPIADSPTDSSLFLIFRDATSERETYGGGRFLSARVRADGLVEVDFNKAYNPPCAFNPFTTCPLPPAGTIFRWPCVR